MSATQSDICYDCTTFMVFPYRCGRSPQRSAMLHSSSMGRRPLPSTRRLGALSVLTVRRDRTLDQRLHLRAPGKEFRLLHPRLGLPSWNRSCCMSFKSSKFFGMPSELGRRGRGVLKEASLKHVYPESSPNISFFRLHAGQLHGSIVVSAPCSITVPSSACLSGSRSSTPHRLYATHALAADPTCSNLNL
jgi:hypothetical protein